VKKINPEILLITNSIYPYHLHNVSVLSLPFGTAYRFRYEHRHLELGSLAIEDLRDKAGVVVLRDYERATFIPLRAFKIMNVDDCGEFLFLDLQFLYFVGYSASWPETSVASGSPGDFFVNEREKYSGIVADQLGTLKIQNAANQSLSKLILWVQANKLGGIALETAMVGPKFADAWIHVVNVLAGMAVYKGVCFYVISSVLTLNSGKDASRFSTRWRAGLELRTGRVYMLRIYQVISDRTTPTRPGFKLRLGFIGAHLNPLRSEEPVDGPYDRLSYLVFTLPQESETNESELLLSCDQPIFDPSDTARSSQIPPTPVQLRIRWPRWARFVKWVVHPALFVVGAGLFVMADKVQQFFAFSDNGKYLVQLIGLALLAIGGKTWGFLTGSIKSGPPGSKA
jgi:hypothetical protein